MISRDLGYYVLLGHEPVPELDTFAWAAWFETADRKVARTEVGPITVSTVFLGVDHAVFNGPPALFETMIFDGLADAYQERCATWDQAEKMHVRAVRIARRRWAKAQPLLKKMKAC